MALSAAEVRRYSRQLVMPDYGVEGQLKLKASKVLVIGTGGLGAPVSLYLAAAGVGTLGLVDFDVVDESNLHRQVLFSTDEIGRSKVKTAQARLSALNPQIEIRAHELRLQRDNALELIAPYDIVVDGTDNFPTRYLTNDACVLLKKPYVYGSILRSEGQATVFGAPGGPCYRCLFPVPPPPGAVPSCAEGGVLGVLPGLVGCIQANETLKLIMKHGDSLSGRLLLIDALAMTFDELSIARRADCPLCGDTPTIHALVDYDQFCGISRQKETVPSISVQDLKARMDRGADFLLLDVREAGEQALASLGGTLIPLGQLASRLAEVDPNKEIIVHCKSGARSARAVELLRQAGYQRVYNLSGGILAWAQTIDLTMPQY